MSGIVKNFLLSLIVLIYISYTICKIIDLPEERIFVLDNKNMNIKAKINKEFAIKIKANPTTGYNWYLIENTDIGKLENLNLSDHKTSTDYVSSNSDPHIMGAGGFYYFRFKPINSGIVKLNFVHKRIWEKNDLANIIVEVNVEQ
jgi:predicted secreted protein